MKGRERGEEEEEEGGGMGAGRQGVAGCKVDGER